ncbi:hypothetical protein V5799_014967 [Amblyomma americanum]|uniref:Uncharacterized protein n=1 Tax=Amblyomma americanum TaxID=6943 RepID=A0AAQ4E1H8_AMBAM
MDNRAYGLQELHRITRQRGIIESPRCTTARMACRNCTASVLGVKTEFPRSGGLPAIEPASLLVRGPGTRRVASQRVPPRRETAASRDCPSAWMRRHNLGYTIQYAVMHQAECAECICAHLRTELKQH